MKIQVKNEGPNYVMQAENEAGLVLQMDSSAQAQPAGFSPMQLLLAGLAGCSTIDVRIILEKQRQALGAIYVEVQGHRIEHSPKTFERINLHYTFHGSLDEEKVQKALALTFDKYCSVAKMLDQVAKLEYTFDIQP